MVERIKARVGLVLGVFREMQARADERLLQFHIARGPCDHQIHFFLSAKF